MRHMRRKGCPLAERLAVTHKHVEPPIPRLLEVMIRTADIRHPARIVRNGQGRNRTYPLRCLGRDELHCSARRLIQTQSQLISKKRILGLILIVFLLRQPRKFMKHGPLGPHPCEYQGVRIQEPHGVDSKKLLGPNHVAQYLEIVSRFQIKHPQRRKSDSLRLSSVIDPPYSLGRIYDPAVVRGKDRASPEQLVALGHRPRAAGFQIEKRNLKAPPLLYTFPRAVAYEYNPLPRGRERRAHPRFVGGLVDAPNLVAFEIENDQPRQRFARIQDIHDRKITVRREVRCAELDLVHRRGFAHRELDVRHRDPGPLRSNVRDEQGDEDQRRPRGSGAEPGRRQGPELMATCTESPPERFR